MKSTSQSMIRWVSRTAVLFALTLVIQLLGLPQFITGPLVNAFLLLATMMVGVSSGMVIGLFTPWVAFSRGILPAPMGPMIPFIMLGNVTLVIVFFLITTRRENNLGFLGLGIVIGAIAKYLVLSQSVAFLVSVPPPVAKMMQFPQLITALIGGVVAIVIKQALVRTNFFKNRS
ncbi:MAG TPA: ECF transporter S component [Candidatus Atribacteria bacterium]|nr:ECF transporter S component [Candidatus Atribacteria bacterium]